MSDRSSRRDMPGWVWAVGCLGLGLLLLCTVAVILGAFFIFGFSIASSSGSPAVTAFASTAVGVPPPTAETTVTPSEDRPATPTDAPPQTRTPTPVAETPNTTSEDPAVVEDDPFAAKRAEIETNVVEIRGLTVREPVRPIMLTTEELRQQLESDFAEDYSPEEARSDVIRLSAFDFFEREFDLYSFTIDLYTEQTAGYYRPETDEFVIVSDSDGFSALEQWTHAHEFTHALQDQYYDLELLSDENLDSDAILALQALAEGDATLVQTQYLLSGYFSQEDLFEILTNVGEIDTTVLDSAPTILARELEFPYTSGLEFVQRLYEENGFASIDEAWENPPVSAEQIIHPDRYLSGDAPQIVSLVALTETLGADWQRLDEDTLGEFYLREYLDQQLSENEAAGAAAGWGGDRYSVYWQEASEQLVMVLRLVWDTAADGDEFAAAQEAYAQRLLGGPATDQSDGGRCWSGGAEVICLYRVGEATMVVRAPDLETAAAVAAVQ